MPQENVSEPEISLNNNTQFWLERLRTEVAAIPDAEQSVVSEMMVAEIELAQGLEDAACVTLARCLQRFGFLHPGT